MTPRKKKVSEAPAPARRPKRVRDAGGPPQVQSASAEPDPRHPSAAPATPASPRSLTVFAPPAAGPAGDPSTTLAAISAAAGEAARAVAAAEPVRPLRERAKARVGVADLLLFRVGRELFAADLAAIDEAIELPEVHRLPETPDALLGMFSLRGRMTPVYSPSRALGVALASAAAATLVVRSRDRRIALAVDDVEDVLRLDLATLRDPPSLGDDKLLLGVARHGTHLVAVVDADALVAACLTDRAMEPA